jgi:hypothetical protein
LTLSKLTDRCQQAAGLFFGQRRIAQECVRCLQLTLDKLAARPSGHKVVGSSELDDTIFHCGSVADMPAAAQLNCLRRLRNEPYVRQVLDIGSSRLVNGGVEAQLAESEGS